MKTINVKAYTGRKFKKIEFKDDVYHVYVSDRPIDGEANQSIKAELSNFFKVPKICITLIKGLKSREKIFQIDD